MQTHPILLAKMHTERLPRSRPQQGRVGLPRPLRRKVLRGQHQGVGEDARRGRAKSCWRWWGFWAVKLVAASDRFTGDVILGNGFVYNIRPAFSGWHKRNGCDRHILHQFSNQDYYYGVH